LAHGVLRLVVGMVTKGTALAFGIALVALSGCSFGSDDADKVLDNQRAESDKSHGKENLFGLENIFGGGSGAATFKKRVTGADLDTSARWRVAGTDLGIPYVLENGSIGYLFGDTFDVANPNQTPNYWRSPVMLRSASKPADGIVFDSAAKVAGDGPAPGLFFNEGNTSKAPGAEWTVIPNDGISFPETGRQLISFMSVHDWDANGEANWRTNYASLAYSDNGNDFTRVPDLGWGNTPDNSDPFQMWTMQRDGDFVYVFSVRAGRQTGPMMLQRVPWDKMFDKGAYQCWGTGDGRTWNWGGPCTPILNGRIGEPSVRKLKSGTWAMAYLNAQSVAIVTRTAPSPTGPWSSEKVQVTFQQESYLYGGFIHPWSDTGANNLHIMVSKWGDGQYHVSQYVGTL
jgi:hypothetical protein